MESLAKIHHRHQPLHLSLHHHRLSFSRPISSLPFKSPPPPPLLSPLKLSLSIRAKSSSSSSFTDPLLPNPKTSNPQFTETLNPSPFSLLKTVVITAVAATTVFSARFNLKPLLAASMSPPPTVETVSDEDREKTLEEYLCSHSDDVQALRKLMEVKIKKGKVDEAVGIIEQLIVLEPSDIELPLLKAHLHLYNEQLEMAKLGFNEILKKDPAKVEAYHGLVMAASQTDDTGNELKEIEKKLGVAMSLCKREKKKDELRDIKLLIAQIRVIEGNYNEALKVYEELVKEEPRDFRPYLCQGIIYVLLRKKDEAEKQFQKYRRLVPKGHPYAQYFDDNMIATKILGQKVENERAASKS